MKFDVNSKNNGFRVLGPLRQSFGSWGALSKDMIRSKIGLVINLINN